MKLIERYACAAIQTDLPGPVNRAGMKKNTSRMIRLLEQAVEGYGPFFPVRLVVFPEFAHAAPVYATARELRRKLAVEIPNAETDRLARKAAELDVYIQSGTMLEEDSRYPNAVFNTTCLIGPTGILSRYRKVYPWVPWEVHTSPHDLEGYEEELFPVVETEIGRLGVAVCYDWLFPEVLRSLALGGAEVLIRVSAYMDPWGATEPMDWWTVVNRCRALENLAYVVAANQGARVANYPPFSWPGGSMVVDYDGRILSQATPGDGERIVVAEIDVGALRHTRASRVGHQMLAHLRNEAHSVGGSVYPPGRFRGQSDWTVTENEKAIEEGRRGLGFEPPG